LRENGSSAGSLEMVGERGKYFFILCHRFAISLSHLAYGNAILQDGFDLHSTPRHLSLPLCSI
jgi:hypothetical protein